MSNLSRILFCLLTLAVIVSIAVTYETMVVQKDFVIINDLEEVE